MKAGLLFSLGDFLAQRLEVPGKQRGQKPTSSGILGDSRGYHWNIVVILGEVDDTMAISWS